MHQALTMHLDPHPSSVRTARNVARAFVASWAPDTFQEEVALLVSEVVTNAVLHAGSRVRVELTETARALRVETFDASSDLPVLAEPTRAATTGRGMQLVDALSTRWGCRPCADGKAVWFELEGPLPVSSGRLRAPE